MSSFRIRQATMLVDRPEDLPAGQSLNMPTVLYADVVEGRVQLQGQALVVSRLDPLARVKELVARGVSNADVRYVDLSDELPLPDMVAHQRDRLRWLFAAPVGVLGDRVRLLHQWPDPPAFIPWWTGDPAFDGFLRWRPRNLAVVVGDEGSGKSTFSQILAMKLLTGPTLATSAVRASVCAWEDDIAVFRDMVFKFAPRLDERIYWFEPDADPERLLDEYLTNIEYLSRHEGVSLHIADPWNAFNHDPGGDLETKYVQRMLLEMQKLTRALNITIIVVTHLPKRPGRGLRPFGIADSSGSKEFSNKCDMGICIANTTLIAELQAMTDEELKMLRVARSHVDGAVSAHGEFKGKEHMIVVTDKVKIRGMEKRGMGRKAVRAFVLDRENTNLVLDPAATEIAKRLWR
jgi:AAA domain